jgi:DNA-binding HxlR family transcriptional regulator
MPKNNRNELSFEPDLLLISNALVIVSGKWRLYIILVLGEQTLRYSQLSDRLPGVSEKVLAGELKALVTLGVMKREAFAEVPLRVDFTYFKTGTANRPNL